MLTTQLLRVFIQSVMSQKLGEHTFRQKTQQVAQNSVN